MHPAVWSLCRQTNLSQKKILFLLKKIGDPCPDNPTQPVCRAFREPSKQICEGWAPPPIAIHGPKFRDLSNQEKSDLKKLHQKILVIRTQMFWQNT